MKNKFLHGAAALALCAGFVACSEYDAGVAPETLADIKSLQYETAFVQKFGKIDPEQDWGFGSSTPTETRAIQPSYDFPSDAPASKFLESVPEGIKQILQNDASVDGWIDSSWSGEFKAWGAWNGSANVGGTLYLKAGEYDFTSRTFYFAGNSELYLVKGVTLKLNAENAGNLQGGTKIYIAEGAKIVADGELKANKGLFIYNHGTIEADQLSVNENSVVYNVGTITVAGKVSVDNGESVLVNDGVLTAGELNTAGSGKFENNFTAKITGDTSVNSNNNTWVNNGSYETKNFIYNAASDEVINNCKMIINEDFNINLGDNPGNGDFKMDAGSSVVTKNFNGGRYKAWYPDWNNYRDFNGGPFYIYMGSNSVFKVTNIATMDATKANYGIYGPNAGDYAVFEAERIVAGQANQGYEVTYGGNLAVVTKDHFANGYSGTYPYIDFKGNAKIYATAEETNISIPESECNPGFNPGRTPEPDPDEDEVVEQGRIFCEDLGSIGDFDFNDVVFDAYIYKSGKIEIVLWAAGGTLPITVAGYNPHDYLGTGMVNTGVKEGKESYHTLNISAEDAKTLCTDENNDGKISINEIPVVVSQSNSAGEIEKILLRSEKGNAPQKICVPIDTCWPAEYQSIEDAYPVFKQWVKNRELKPWNSGVSSYLYNGKFSR